MALKGQAKVDYQRFYMRRRRSNTGSNKQSESVRPSTLLVRPAGVSNSQWNYIKLKAGK